MRSLKPISLAGKQSISAAVRPSHHLLWKAVAKVEAVEPRLLYSSTMATFAGGNGSTSSGQFPGVASNGWATPWTETDINDTVTSAAVLSTSTLDDGGKYLSIATTATSADGAAAISRGYSTSVANSVDTGAAYQISFNYRVDSSLTAATNYYDRTRIWGDSGANAYLGGSVTWAAEVFGATNGSLAADHWGFQNGGKNDSVSQPFVDSGITAVSGTVYHFIINVDPTTNTYTASISDGLSGAGHSFTSGTLGFATKALFNSSTTTYINAGAQRAESGESASWSLDSLKIAGLPVSGLTAVANSDSSISLSWLDKSTASTEYQIIRSVNGGTYELLTSVAATATSYVDVGLTAGVTYSYEIVAVNQRTNSPATPAVSITLPDAVAVTTPPAGPVTTPAASSPSDGTTIAVPNIPSDLAASSSSYQEINLSWTESSANPTGFDIERSLDGANYTVIGTTTDTTYADKQSSLILGDTYYYKVAAYNDAGASQYTLGVAGTPVLPNLPAYSAPSSDPALPVGTDTFQPPVSSQTIVSGAPAIAASTLNSGPDDTITLTGAAFTDDSAADYADTKVIVYGQTSASNGTLADAQVQSSSADGITATISATEPNGSMYFVWPENSSGIGSPVAVNQTTAQWISPAAPAPSTTVSVYGRNLDNSAGESWVYLQPSSGTGQWTQVTDANAYRVQFTLPSGLTAGAKYQVWVYNGQGGVYGWSAPLNITVGLAQAWNGIVNVKNFGATGNGTTDDGPAIQAAIKSLTGHETLYFPAGTYRVNGEQLDLPSNVRLMGDSPTSSVIRFDGAVPNVGAGAFEIGVYDSYYEQNVDFESIGLTYNGPTTGQGTDSLIRERFANEMTFNNVVLIANNLTPIDWEGSTNISITNSTVRGVGIFVNGCQGITFDNDLLLQSFDSYGQEAITFWGDKDIVVTNCTTENYYQYELSINPGQPYDPTAFGEGRFLSIDLLSSDSYVASNKTIDLGEDLTPADHNSGEQILSEGTQDAEAPVLSATANTFTFAGNQSSGSAGWNAIVTSGIGLGQELSISSAVYSSSTNTTVFTLNKDFTVIPSAGSHISVSDSPSNLVFYQNSLSHTTGAYASQDGSSVGFEFFTGIYGLVVDGNTIDNTRTGITVWSAGVNTPVAFADIINNAISGVQTGIGVAPDGRTDPDFYGVEVKNNTISGASTSYATAGAGLAFNVYGIAGEDTLTVFEHNTVEGFPVGLETVDDQVGLAYKNSFSLGSATFNGSAGVYAKVSMVNLLLKANTFTGYATAVA